MIWRFWVALREAIDLRRQRFTVYCPVVEGEAVAVAAWAAGTIRCTGCGAVIETALDHVVVPLRDNPKP